MKDTIPYVLYEHLYVWWQRLGHNFFFCNSLKPCLTRHLAIILKIFINEADPGKLLRAQELCSVAATIAFLTSHYVHRWPTRRSAVELFSVIHKKIYCTAYFVTPWVMTLPVLNWSSSSLSTSFKGFSYSLHHHQLLQFQKWVLWYHKS